MPRCAHVSMLLAQGRAADSRKNPWKEGRAASLLQKCCVNLDCQSRLPSSAASLGTVLQREPHRTALPRSELLHTLLHSGTMFYSWNATRQFIPQKMLITADWFISLLPRVHNFPRKGNTRQMLLDLRPAGLNRSCSAVCEHSESQGWLCGSADHRLHPQIISTQTQGVRDNSAGFPEEQ